MTDSTLGNQKAGRPLVMAHRGGAGLWPENTIYAFERAVSLGVDVLEMDMRATRDGHLVIIHDAAVERTTDGRGAVNSFTLEELKRLDAAYSWSPDGGSSFPLRGTGITVPTLSEIFSLFPTTRLNIDIKQERPAIVEPFCAMIRERGMQGQIMVASFNQAVLDQFRAECAEVATSGSVMDIGAFLALKTEHSEAEAGTAAKVRALQVPEYAGGRRLLTPRFIEEAHRRRLEVHAWTINTEAEMQRMIEMRIDGIITDFPDRLLNLLSG
jgi:glycerophosphoryl diester phosphodiesterase